MNITPETLYTRWRRAVRERDWVAALVLAKAVDEIAGDPQAFRKMREARQINREPLYDEPGTYAAPQGANALSCETRPDCEAFSPELEVESNE